MTDENKTREANEKIAACLELAKRAIKEAQGIADENKIEFDFSLGYGMGGTYRPKGWIESGCSHEEDEDEGRWMSSSSMC